jgi:hypothetical protein
VQYLADDEVYCCTTCAVTWKAAYETTIPAGMTVEEWARMAMDAPALLERLKAMTAIVKAVIKTRDDGGPYHSLPGFDGRTITENLHESLAVIAKAEGRQ